MKKSPLFRGLRVNQKCRNRRGARFRGKVFTLRRALSTGNHQIVCVHSPHRSAPMIANTLEAVYYVVIFATLRTDGDHGYDAMAERRAAL